MGSTHLLKIHQKQRLARSDYVSAQTGQTQHTIFPSVLFLIIFYYTVHILNIQLVTSKPLEKAGLWAAF